MNGSVATGTPARALLQKRGVVDMANVDFTLTPTFLDLRMAFQAKIWIALHQQLAVDRTVWSVANDAALPQRFMLKDKWPRLLPMALRATLVQAGHRQPARRLEDVASMRIVALHAVQPVFDGRMAMREIKFSVSFQVTLKTRGRILPWINDKNSASASGCNVLATRAVARFTTRPARKPRRLQMHTRVSTAWKMPGNIGMTLGTGFIAYVIRPRNLRRRQHGAFHSGT